MIEHAEGLAGWIAAIGVILWATVRKLLTTPSLKAIRGVRDELKGFNERLTNIDRNIIALQEGHGAEIRAIQKRLDNLER